MAVLLETPFDPQALFTALNYISNVFNAASWQNLLKLFFMIALINGIVSVGIYRKTDYVKQFIIALGFASVLSYPINNTLAIKRADTERVYTINNSKAPFILVEGIRVVNLVTKWFTSMAGASINSPNYTGMYDAGIGSNANIIRNSIDMAIPDPKVKADLVQFIKECTLYDIRDGVVPIHDLVNKGNGFDLIFNNTSPARFVSINSSTGRPEVKTCHDAAQVLKTQVNYEAQKALTGKASMFFYQKDVAPLVMYSTAVQSSYQTQLGINSDVSQIAKQNMFNHLLEVSGEDIGKLLNDPSMAESAAIHMGVARAAKKAAFQQSIVAQLGKEILPAMSSWFAIIIIMLFPFVVLIFVIAQFNNMWQILVGYMGTLFWICCWQPIFAIINGLANWELGRQLEKRGAFRQDGIPYGFVTPVYDTLLSNHSMVGWMVMLTPIIAGMVVYGTYRGFSHLGNSIFSTFSGASSAVGNEMSDGNLNMGNTNLGNSSLGNLTQNTTSANKYNPSPVVESGIFSINDGVGTTSHYFSNKDVVKTQDRTDFALSEYSTTQDARVSQSSYFSGNQSFSVNKNTGWSSEQGASIEQVRSSATDITQTTGTESSTSNTSYRDNNNSVSSGTQTSTVSVIGSSQSSTAGSNNSQNIHNSRNTSVQDSVSDSYTTTGQSSWNIGIGGSGGVSGGRGKGGIGGIAGALGSLVNGGLNTGETVAQNSSSGRSSITSDTKGISQDESTFNRNENSSFTNQYQQSGRVSSNIHTNTSGNRFEKTDREFTSDTTATTVHSSNGLTESASARTQEGATVQIGLNQEVGDRQEGIFGEVFTKNVNLGLVTHLDSAAQWVHDNNKPLFDEILKHYNIDPQHGMQSYYDTEGDQRRNLRLDFAQAQHQMKQSNTLTSQPEARGVLPTSRSTLDENYEKYSPNTLKVGQDVINKITTNFDPKK